MDGRIAADPVDVVAAFHAQPPGHRRQRARRNDFAVVLVGRDIAVLAKRAAHVARGEEYRPRALAPAVDELLAGMVEVARNARPGGELAGADLRAPSTVDSAIPPAEIAVREHAIGERTAEVEETRRGPRRKL